MLDEITLDHSRSKTAQNWVIKEEDNWWAKPWTHSPTGSCSWALKAGRVNQETHHSPQLIPMKKDHDIGQQVKQPPPSSQGSFHKGLAEWSSNLGSDLFITTKIKHSVGSRHEWNQMPTCFLEWLSNTDQVKIKVILINPLLLSSPQGSRTLTPKGWK